LTQETDMLTETPAAPTLLTPTGDATPVEHAVTEGIIHNFAPETFLWIIFRRPDGGSRVWYGWTQGGAPLGNQIDKDAVAAGMDGADWLHIIAAHCEEHTRGRVQINAHALRPILSAVRTGQGAPEAKRAQLRQMVNLYGKTKQWAPLPAEGPVSRWAGVGPALLEQ
jgi:hypothetical protein